MKINLSTKLFPQVNILQGSKIGVVASCHSTFEEQILTKRLADLTKAEIFLRGHFGEDDGILLSADRSPNLRGALVTELIQKYPEDNLFALNDAITSDVEVLLVMNEDLIKSGISEENLAKVKIVYIGTHSNSSSHNADVVLPGLSVFEKRGSFINRSFILQAFFELCIPGPVGLKAKPRYYLPLLLSYRMKKVF